MEAERVRRQLDRILTSATLREAGRASAFLRFVVERKLSGRASEIKETIIGVEVLGRNPSFDPRLDPIVRTEAGRLRTVPPRRKCDLDYGLGARNVLPPC